MTDESVKSAMKRLSALPSGYRTADSLSAAKKEIAGYLRARPWTDAYGDRVVSRYLNSRSKDGFPTVAALEETATEVPEFRAGFASDCPSCSRTGLYPVLMLRTILRDPGANNRYQNEQISEAQAQELRPRLGTGQQIYSAVDFCTCEIGRSMSHAWREWGSR